MKTANDSISNASKLMLPSVIQEINKYTKFVGEGGGEREREKVAYLGFGSSQQLLHRSVVSGGPSVPSL